ncbi:MAG: type II toxin-antitoxin system VapC family toxin [Magnetococcales bacterium]|nr:type II toxin-antitoxin system VapC family toxin [Magnetococcales bacterium]
MPPVMVLDSHIWYWWINLEHDRLPQGMLQLIESAPRVGVSPVSCFELALACRRGRLELPMPPQDWFVRALDGSGVELLPLTAGIAARAVDLADIHRDPFDRIIIATAIELDARLASVDGRFFSYPELADRLIGSRR